MQEQLEALDAERQAEASQGRKPEPAAGAEPLGRCQELGEKGPERHKDGDVRERLDRPLSTLPEHAGEIQRQVMPCGMSHNTQIPSLADVLAKSHLDTINAQILLI